MMWHEVGEILDRQCLWYGEKVLERARVTEGE